MHSAYKKLLMGIFIFSFFVSLASVKGKGEDNSNSSTDSEQVTSQTVAKENSLVYHVLPHELDESEDTAYAGFLAKVFRKAETEKPHLVILEINTPGGELAATLKIKNVLLTATTPTLCFINKNAISAGSLIALSCDKIVMANGGVIGAATPVFQTGEGMQKAPEKVVSATRAAWRSAAEANGKDPNIAEAFVDESIVLTRQKNGINKPKGKLLTLTTKEALQLKIADYQAENIETILKKENIEQHNIITWQPEFFDKLLAFFTNPTIAGILLGLGILALVYELKVPGWGISGALGITFISIYFISLILLGVTGWGAPALFAFGILLMLLEIFVIPGFGLAGTIGLLSLFGAIFWSYGFAGTSDALWVVSIAMLSMVGGIVLIYNSLPAIMKKNKSIFLTAILNKESAEDTKKYQDYLHQKGVAFTSLRPAGIVHIDGIKVDALSQGEYIEKDEPVEVIYVEGNKIVVKSVATNET